MYFYIYPHRRISRINKAQRSQQALLIKVQSGRGTEKPIYYELLFPKIPLEQLELEAASHIGSAFFSVTAFLRCCYSHLYALKPVRLSRLKRSYRVIAGYGSMGDLIRVNAEQYRQASQEATGQSMTFLEYRRRRRDGPERWPDPYRHKVASHGIEDPRECGDNFQARLDRLEEPAPIEPAECRTYTAWYRLATQPKGRGSRKRKERLPKGDWFNDYLAAFTALGWSCQNRGIHAGRVKLTPEEQRNMTHLTFQKDRSAVVLYSSVKHVPSQYFQCAGWNDCIKPVDNFVRIVTGRRPDIKRHVCRKADGTATRIIPDLDAKDVFSRMQGRPPTNYPREEEKPKVKFYVDFDNGLFEPTKEGTWLPCADEYANKVYRAYLAASPHYKSFRGYERTQVKLSPRGALKSGNPQ